MLKKEKNLSIRQRIYGYKSYTRCKELFDVEKRGSKKKQLQWIKNKRVKIENNHIYVWNTIDVDDRFILTTLCIFYWNHV